MSSYNRVILLGNLTRDVELKYTQNNKAVASTGLAVNENEDNVLFIDLTFWGKTAEIASEYTQKGSSILVEGRLKLDSWTDQSTNAKRSKIVMVVDRMQLLGKKKDATPAQEDHNNTSPKNTDTETPAVETNEDIPF